MVGCGGSDRQTAATSRPDQPALYPLQTGGQAGSAANERRFDARRLIGQDIRSGRRLAAHFGCTIRITSGDGAPDAITGDLDPRRIDVSVDRETITGLDDLNRSADDP